MAETQKHTPGPWEYHQGDDYAVVLGHGDTTDRPLAEVNSGKIADARLIAAAPDMLAALKHAERNLSYIAGRLGDEPPALTEVRAAIAKAEGR